MHIDRPLQGPLVGTSIARLEMFLLQTYYEDERPMECDISAHSMTSAGDNIDLAFWPIGRWGIWKSRLATLINDAFYPKSGFSYCVALYREVEQRTGVDLLSPYCIRTAMARQEGCSSNIRNIRQNWHKKFRPGYATPARLPYAIATNQIPLLGFLRFDINRPMQSVNITGRCRGSIYIGCLSLTIYGESLIRAQNSAGPMRRR